MEKKTEIIYGIRPVIEAIRSGKDIDKVLIRDSTIGENITELRKLLADYKIPYTFVPAEKLNRMCSANHQGVLCTLSPVCFVRLDDVIPAIYEKGELPLILVLDRITDVRNFGAIVRTANCAGVHVIVVPEKGSAQIGGDAIKTSAGALYHVPVSRVKSMRFAMEFLKKSGLNVIACTEKTKTSIYKLDFKPPTAFIIGSEEDGISPELIRAANQTGRIPLNGNIDSLNVSVAAGVVLYEALRQRNCQGITNTIE